MKRILWISRHPPLLKQIEELKRIFGNIEIIQYASRVRDAKHVIELVETYNAHDVVTILPMTIIYHLVNVEGLKPIYPEMEEVPKNCKNFDYEDWGSGRRYRFKGFVRITGFIIEKQPLT